MEVLKQTEKGFCTYENQGEEQFDKGKNSYELYYNIFSTKKKQSLQTLMLLQMGAIKLPVRYVLVS